MSVHQSYLPVLIKSKRQRERLKERQINGLHTIKYFIYFSLGFREQH